MRPTSAPRERPRRALLGAIVGAALKARDGREGEASRRSLPLRVASRLEREAIACPRGKRRTLRSELDCVGFRRAGDRQRRAVAAGKFVAAGRLDVDIDAARRRYQRLVVRAGRKDRDAAAIRTAKEISD
jgi:hypothetical protein